jgi:tetratricopeptide (TPR) repeat protein
MKKVISILLVIALFFYSQNAAEYYRKGLTKASSNDHVAAIKEYTISIGLDGSSSDAFFNRALSQDNLGNYQEAVSDYIKVAELNPNDICVFLYR